MALGVAAVLLMLAPPALGRTFTVTRADDPNPPGPCNANDCSLRAAVFAADDHSGADKIRFAPSLPPMIHLTQGELPIRFKLEIDGPGSKNLAVRASGSRVLHMTQGRVTIDGIAIRDGRETAAPNGATCPGDSANAYTAGGGILQDAGNLKLDHVKVANNAVDGPAASIIGGGGIADIDGTLTVTHSRLTQNAVDGGSISGGGGILNCVGQVTVKHSSIHDSAVSSKAIGSGGAIANGLGAAQNTGELTLKKTTVEKNNASSEVVSEGGGVITTGGPVDVEGTTINENSATVTGGGTVADAGGFENANSKVTFTNSTIANNIAIAPSAIGGGIAAGGNDEKLKIESSTVVGNIADGTTTSRGGNLVSSDSASLKNTIVAKGKATTGSNCDFAVKSSGHDLEDEDTCGFDGKGDRVNKNPKLRDLANNGGPTDTMALKQGSPAIGHASKKTSPKRDQRGFKRDGKPDIGAYEFGAKP